MRETGELEPREANLLLTWPPHIDSLLQDDAYTYDSYDSLASDQKVIVFSVIADFAAAQRFGRTTGESPRIVKDKRSGQIHLKDPLLQSYERRFRRVGIKDAEDYVTLAVSASETVLEGYHRDPTLWP